MSDRRSSPNRLLLAFAIFLAHHVNLTQAFWTVDCGIVATEKTDPIRSFGIESSHVHIIAGSSAIGPTSTNADLRGGGMALSPSSQASGVPFDFPWLMSKPSLVIFWNIMSNHSSIRDLLQMRAHHATSSKICQPTGFPSSMWPLQTS